VSERNAATLRRRGRAQDDTGGAGRHALRPLV